MCDTVGLLLKKGSKFLGLVRLRDALKYDRYQVNLELFDYLQRRLLILLFPPFLSLKLNDSIVAKALFRSNIISTFETFQTAYGHIKLWI